MNHMRFIRLFACLVLFTFEIGYNGGIIRGIVGENLITSLRYSTILNLQSNLLVRNCSGALKLDCTILAIVASFSRSYIDLLISILKCVYAFMN